MTPAEKQKLIEDMAALVNPDRPDFWERWLPLAVPAIAILVIVFLLATGAGQKEYDPFKHPPKKED